MLSVITNFSCLAAYDAQCEGSVQTQSSQLRVEALAGAVCTGLGAAIPVPVWSRGQMLDLRELDH